MRGGSMENKLTGEYCMLEQAVFGIGIGTLPFYVMYIL